jgi:uncharacterized protein YodC (DUF2158 family)
MVQLKIGGPVMLVDLIVGDLVQCLWFEPDQSEANGWILKWRSFHASLLIPRVNPEHSLEKERWLQRKTREAHRVAS